MVGRRLLPWSMLAIAAALTAPSIVRAQATAGVLRIQSTTENDAPIALGADTLHSWSDADERVFTLEGKVLIEQGQTRIWAARAVVWIESAPLQKRRPARVFVYADAAGGKKVGIETRGSPRQNIDAVVIESTTPIIQQIRGQERQAANTRSELYRTALAARGRPLEAGDPAPIEQLPDFRPGVEPVMMQEPKAKTAEPPKKEPEKVVGTTAIPVPLVEERTIWISPRTNKPFNISPVVTGKEKAAIVTGGIKLLAQFSKSSIKSLEVEADQAVIWQKEGDSTGAVDAMRSEEGARGADQIELYLTGNVVIRFSSPEDATAVGVVSQSRTLRADRVYYDVSNHKAIAVSADLEYTREGFANTGHVVASVIEQLSSTEFTARDGTLHASRLPSDPGMEITFDKADVYREPRTARRTIFGTPFRDRRSGEMVEWDPDILEAEGVRILARDTPIFYWPSTRTNVKDPFGPFEGVTFRQDRIFGFQLYGTWDMLDLIGLTPVKGERWSLLTDYMSIRGPALGTTYTRNSLTFFDLDAPHRTTFKAYGVYDEGFDVLGGPREKAFNPPALRGRMLFQHQQEFSLFDYHDLTVNAQASYLSDRNFLESYYNTEYNYGPNQESFAWLKYQTGNAAATFLVQPDLGMYWFTQTYWLPKAEGYLIGQSLFERLTYHTWASAGYAELDTFRPPINEYPNLFTLAFPPFEKNVNTGRFDWMQKVSAPFDAGPFRVVPYGVLDLAYYTQDNDGARRGRVYGGGGMKASVPLSRLYDDVESELFNVQGIYHKNVFSVNYYNAGSTTPWLSLPQLDRLNDDAANAAVLDITPWQTTFPQLSRDTARALQFGSYNKFNPRLYAIRRLVDTNVDTLDDIQVVQLDWNQRFQTKRGYPGLEHEVNWFTLNTSASVFPAANRDNFGQSVAFLEYQAVWNVGDRNSIFSNGWVDPFDFGAQYWNVGTQFFRDDRTQYTLTYQTINPLESRLVTGSATYIFSPKYAVTVLAAYDFSYQESLTQALYFTRVGTDMQITLGLTYNSIINNLGLTLNIVPNLIANQTAPIGQRAFGGPGGGFAGAGGAGGAGR